MRTSNLRIHLLLGIGLLFGALMTGSFVSMDLAFAADTPEAQQKKARAFIEARRQRASKSAGCVFGKVVAAGVDTTGPLIVIIHCTASNEYIIAMARNELKQDILTMGLAAMSSGKHIGVDVVDGVITGFAITEIPFDDR